MQDPETKEQVTRGTGSEWIDTPRNDLINFRVYTGDSITLKKSYKHNAIIISCF